MLFSHKQGVLYVEHCRIVCADGQLSFVRAEKALEKFWSIPHANLCVLLCGPGTSITHQAAHKLAEEGVIFGFTSGGGTPLFLASLSEYRPTEYCQAWLKKWQNEAWRLKAAKHLAAQRCLQVAAAYKKDSFFESSVEAAIVDFQGHLCGATSTQQLLGFEATFAKRLYAYHARICKVSDFKRNPQSNDHVNKLIDNGNYMAYGLAASVLWALGIPHAFPVIHGHTRRGALVFDLADVIKDAMVLPIAFASAGSRQPEQVHRAACLAALDRHKALPALFDTVKACLALSDEPIQPPAATC